MSGRTLAVAAWLLLLVTGAPHQPAQAQAAEPLRIAIYGASGRMGSRVAAEALNRGHYVTGVARNPENISARHQRLAVAQGDILDTESVIELIAGHDVVVSAISTSDPSITDPMLSTPRRAAESLVGALRALGGDAPRMMVVGGGSTTLDSEPGVPFVDPGDIPAGLRGVNMRGHRLALDYLSAISDVRWTFVSPALQMRPGERTGKFRVGDGVVLRDAQGVSAISMEDLAMAMIDELENPSHIGGRLTAAY